MKIPVEDVLETEEGGTEKTMWYWEKYWYWVFKRQKEKEGRKKQKEVFLQKLREEKELN